MSLSIYRCSYIESCAFGAVQWIFCVSPGVQTNIHRTTGKTMRLRRRREKYFTVSFVILAYTGVKILDHAPYGAERKFICCNSEHPTLMRVSGERIMRLRRRTGEKFPCVSRGIHTNTGRTTNKTMRLRRSRKIFLLLP